MRRGCNLRSRRRAALFGAVAALTLASTSLHAGSETQPPVSADEANAAATELPRAAETQQFSGREAIRAIIEKETATMWRHHCVDDAPLVSATFAAGTLARVSLKVAFVFA
jgi:hypothetical protein